MLNRWESYGIHKRLYYVLVNIGGKGIIPQYINLQLMLDIDSETAKKLAPYGNISEAVEKYGLDYCIKYADIKKKEHDKYMEQFKPYVNFMVDIFQSIYK